MDIMEQIMTIAKDTFRDEGLQPTFKIESARAFDSMGLVQFTIELESYFKVKIGDDEVIGSMTFEEVREVLQKKINP